MCCGPAEISPSEPCKDEAKQSQSLWAKNTLNKLLYLAHFPGCSIHEGALCCAVLVWGAQRKFSAAESRPVMCNCSGANPALGDCGEKSEHGFGEGVSRG